MDMIIKDSHVLIRWKVILIMWCVRNDVRFVVGYDTKMVLAVDRKTFLGEIRTRATYVALCCVAGDANGETQRSCTLACEHGHDRCEWAKWNTTSKVEGKLRFLFFHVLRGGREKAKEKVWEKEQKGEKDWNQMRIEWKLFVYLWIIQLEVAKP